MENLLDSENKWTKIVKIHGNTDEFRENLDSVWRIVVGNPTNRDIDLFKEMFETKFNN